jgi:hypothetical protein
MVTNTYWLVFQRDEGAEVFIQPGYSHIDALAALGDPDKCCAVAAVGVYFCDPQSPWQRGSNENTNGLLRQSQTYLAIIRKI